MQNKKKGYFRYCFCVCFFPALVGYCCALFLFSFFFQFGIFFSAIKAKNESFLIYVNYTFKFSVARACGNWISFSSISSPHRTSAAFIWLHLPLSFALNQTVTLFRTFHQRSSMRSIKQAAVIFCLIFFTSKYPIDCTHIYSLIDRTSLFFPFWILLLAAAAAVVLYVWRLLHFNFIFIHIPSKWLSKQLHNDWPV